MGQAKRKREFFLGFGGTLAAVLGLPATVLSMLDAHVSWPLTAVLVVAAVITSLITNWRRLKPVHLPVDEVMPLRFEHVTARRVHCPSEPAMVAQVAEIASTFFGKDTISVDRYEPLHVKNPLILSCLTSADGDLLGYFDVFPLTTNFGEMFIRGTMGEKDIRHVDLLERSDMHRCTHLYVAGIAAAHPDSVAGKEHACMLVWGLLRYLDFYYGSSERLVLASGVTKAGEELLRRFGLTMDSSAGSRCDGYPLYAMNLTHDEITARLECLPDYSHRCVLDWEPQHWSAANRRARLPRRAQPASDRLRLVYPVASRTNRAS